MGKEGVDIPHDNLYLRIFDAADELCENLSQRIAQTHFGNALLNGINSMLEQAAQRPDPIADAINHALAKVIPSDLMIEIEDEANNYRHQQAQRRAERQSQQP